MWNANLWSWGEKMPGWILIYDTSYLAMSLENIPFDFLSYHICKMELIS